MFKDITIGQYVEGDSPIHKLDARVKILLSMVYIILLFIIDSFTAYAAFVAFTATVTVISRIPLRYVVRGLKPILYILIFTAAVNLFMSGGTTVLWESKTFEWLKITEEGVRNAVKMALRLMLLVTGTSLLTLTTTPIMLTDGIEKILEPFKVIKLPAHEIAMMMTIAIRFIPTLSEETDKIIKAQKARGADFESGNIFRRARAMVPILIPLFISAFKRADDLATAMDSRCYNGGKKRTRMKQMKMTWRDAVAVSVMLVFCTGIIMIR